MPSSWAQNKTAPALTKHSLNSQSKPIQTRINQFTADGNSGHCRTTSRRQNKGRGGRGERRKIAKANFCKSFGKMLAGRQRASCQVRTAPPSDCDWRKCCDDSPLIHRSSLPPIPSIPPYSPVVSPQQIDRISIKHYYNLINGGVNKVREFLVDCSRWFITRLISQVQTFHSRLSEFLNDTPRPRWSGSLHIDWQFELQFSQGCFAWLTAKRPAAVVRRSNKGFRLTSRPANVFPMPIKTSASLSTSFNVAFTPSANLSLSINLCAVSPDAWGYTSTCLRCTGSRSRSLFAKKRGGEPTYTIDGR